MVQDHFHWSSKPTDRLNFLSPLTRRIKSYTSMSSTTNG
ncbi:unnamed protein product [Kuraishia capsulata CBS 1993]|uniref:Uncharacterized protein n=1 Tax=Kuraishia capsulata CBS 1993 TaxID=1382522 RepID=W6MF77_9ASCO|nr:uncharacterized protein KUCA_T00000051001 [Kuraishia capsulata CBS 1993]CDK24091.1 unnamed protein product [Kuraishia capsulata CBS 1993]